MIQSLIDFDVQLFLTLNGLHSPFWDPIMVFASGKLTWIPLYLAIIYYLYRKNQWRFLWILLGVGLAIALADLTSVHLFKNVFQRLRPCHNPDIKEMVNLVTGRCGGKFGFVSSHAANSFAVATLLLLSVKEKWFTISILVWAAVVSYSRVYLGVHYPGDILVGSILGVCIGFAVRFVVKKANTKYKLGLKE